MTTIGFDGDINGKKFKKEFKDEFEAMKELALSKSSDINDESVWKKKLNTGENIRVLEFHTKTHTKTEHFRMVFNLLEDKTMDLVSIFLHMTCN